MITNPPSEPTANVAAAGLVIDGGSSFVSVKSCVTVATQFVACSVSATTPPVPAAGFPVIDAVPSPLSWNDRPDGSEPEMIESWGVGAGAGEPPVASAVNVDDEPTVKSAPAALLKLGGTGSVNGTVGSFELAVFNCAQASSTTPAGTSSVTPPDRVIPETVTV